MAEVLIAGCGYVGTALAERLAGAGHRIYGLRRRPELLPSSVEAIGADLTDRDGLAARVPESIDFVFYPAGADASTDKAYEDVYVRGLRNLIDVLATRDAAPRRIFVVSSTSVYSQDDGGWVDELSPTSPRRFSGKRILESEAVARAAPFASTIVRFGGIYGPGRTRFLDRVARGEVAATETPSYTNRIHRDDCAGALAHLMEVDRRQDLYLAVDDAPEDRSTVVRWLADQLGAPEPPRGDGDTATASKRCSNRRLRAAGYRFTYPTYREGYRDLIAERRAGLDPRA